MIVTVHKNNLLEEVLLLMGFTWTYDEEEEKTIATYPKGTVYEDYDVPASFLLPNPFENLKELWEMMPVTPQEQIDFALSKPYISRGLHQIFLLPLEDVPLMFCCALYEWKTGNMLVLDVS
jgi:hypothetical protein